MNTVLYKLTDADGQSYGQAQWGAGVTHTAPGTGKLCSEGWIHAYTDPYLAMVFNPIHADFTDPLLWVSKGVVGRTNHGVEVGCRSLTTVREIPVPAITVGQRITFALYSVLQVYPDPSFHAWAKRWLDGIDRSRKSARAAERVWDERRAAQAAARVAAAAAWAEEKRSQSTWAARGTAADAAAWAAAIGGAAILAHALTQTFGEERV